MERYVGLYVSLRQTSICVVNQTGSVMREGVVDSDPEAIAAFVRSQAPGVVRIGLATGPTATWLWTELKRLGLLVNRRCGGTVVELLTSKRKPSLAQIRNDLAHGYPFDGSPWGGLLELVRDLIMRAASRWSMGSMPGL
jgi:hypothetical protein